MAELDHTGLPARIIKRAVRPYVERDGKLYRPDGSQIPFTRLPAGEWHEGLSLTRPKYAKRPAYDPWTEDNMLARALEALHPPPDVDPIGGLPAYIIYRDHRSAMLRMGASGVFFVNRGAEVPDPVHPTSRRIHLSAALQEIKMGNLYLASLPDEAFVRLQVAATVLGVCTKTLRRRAATGDLELIKNGPRLTGVRAGTLRKMLASWPSVTFRPETAE